MILVFNASPVIVLAKAGLLNQIVPLAEQIIIPQAVVDEVLRVDDPADPARMSLERPPCPVSSPESPPVPSFLAAWDLGAGESAEGRQLFVDFRVVFHGAGAQWIHAGIDAEVPL